jgi:hypothetical protein
METVKEKINKRIDHCEKVSEELNLFMGWETTVVDREVVLDTVAGKMTHSVSPEMGVMWDVYRFISNYGSKLHSWGLKQKIKEQ